MKDNLKTTENHRLYELALNDHDMMPVIAYGVAGSGKTWGACKYAVEWLGRQKGNKVIIARPNVSFSKSNGFLPGTEYEKNLPWVLPVIRSLEDNGLDTSKREYFEKSGRIQYQTIEHIQGLSFDNSLILIDEVQNLTFDQLRVILTRVGKWSKIVLCGDIAQTSPFFKDSGLRELIDMIDNLDMRFHMIEFMSDDIMRSDLCKYLIESFDRWEEVKHG